MRRVECDVVIVGAGAAGGVLAATLSEHTPARIVLVEKGAHYTRTFFNQREWDMNAMYAGGGARSTHDGAIPVRGGECVGGGTTINAALCFDPVREVWDNWRTDHGLAGFSFDPAASDYGIAGLNVARCVADVRKRLNIHAASDAEVNDNNRVLERGCQSLGFAAKRFELNMRGCIGCGFCAEGCAYDAKQGTMVSYIADAVARGVQLIHHFDVDRIIYAKRRGELRATGISGQVAPLRPGSQPNAIEAGDLRIDAKLVILCAGAIETPALLQRSNHPNPHDVIGRGLVLHPSLPVIGRMERTLTNYRGISGTVYSDHFRRSHGFYLECLFGHPVYGSVVVPGIATEHFETMLDFTRIAGFGVMLLDSAQPENRVVWNAKDRVANIHYRLGDADKARLRFAAARAVEIMLAAGAREVVLPSEEPVGPLPSPRFREKAQAAYCDDLQFRPHQTVVTSAHPQGSAKMGADPRRSVVDARCEAHLARNLILCDSSSFITSCGVNPMVSVMTMARYQGLRIAAEAGRYGM